MSISSSEIKVYPSAFRTVQAPFSSLATEENITRSIKDLAHNFILNTTPAEDGLKFYINGYYFEITKDGFTELDNEFSGENVYASIYVAELANNAGAVLSPNNQSVGAPLDSNDKFIGITFTSTGTEGSTVLHLLTDEHAIVSKNLYRHYSTDIENSETGKAISKTFNTEELTASEKITSDKILDVTTADTNTGLFIYQRADLTKSLIESTNSYAKTLKKDFILDGIASTADDFQLGFGTTDRNLTDTITFKSSDSNYKANMGIWSGSRESAFKLNYFIAPRAVNNYNLVLGTRGFKINSYTPNPASTETSLFTASNTDINLNKLVKFNANIGTDIIPNSDGTLNLGSDIKNWDHIYGEELLLRSSGYSSPGRSNIVDIKFDSKYPETTASNRYQFTACILSAINSNTVSGNYGNSEFRFITSNSLQQGGSAWNDSHTQEVLYLGLANDVQTPTADNEFTPEVSTTGFMQAAWFNATSDRRLKENIKTFEPHKSILDLDVVEFDFKSDKSHHIGCIAQDLQEICPEIVHTSKDGYLTIEENKIVYLLLDEVKKLRKELDELKGE